jgi:hypothetical protein
LPGRDVKLQSLSKEFRRVERQLRDTRKAMDSIRADTPFLRRRKNNFTFPELG